MIAYEIINSANGKRYIGVTVQTIERRLKRHFKQARQGDRTLLHRAIRKHGEARFTIVELASASSFPELLLLERELIRDHGTFYLTGLGYNMTAGGEGCFGVVRSAETRAKISASLMGHPVSDDVREKLAAAGRGKRLSEEHRARISAGVLGKNRAPKSAEHRAKLAAALIGRKNGPTSDATRQKISAAKRARDRERRSAA